ncbi:MAG: head-tail connector protein [Alphaproteobacteria bacterium]
MLYRSEASPIPLISLQEIKTHLRLDHALEDEYLQNLIQGATEWVEHEIGRALLYQTWVNVHQPNECTFEQQATISIDLEYPPLVEIVSIEALLADGAKKPIRRYVLNTNNLMPRLSLGYQHHPIAITYRCGYGERPITVPPTLRQAVLTVATKFYEDRSQNTELKTPLLQSLLNPFRVMRIR